MRKTILSVMIKIILALSLLSVAFYGYVFIDNSNVSISNYAIYSKKVPAVFEDYKIAVISDFHSSSNAKKVIGAVARIKPQLIVITGDTINMQDVVYDKAGVLVDGLVQIAPVYLVSGNNEKWSKNEKEFLEYIAGKGVNVINDKVVEIKYKNNAINLVGHGDIIYADEKMRMDILEKSIETLYGKIENKKNFNMLLFHRAIYFQQIAKQPFDLVLSGHTHGGQVNLPYVKNAILRFKYNTDEYSKGYYRMNDAQMIISGGLEKNLLSPRVLNTPEVVSVTLRCLK